MRIRNFIIAMTALTATATAAAQSWNDKVKKSVLKITTYKADGSVIGTSNGFYLSDDGVATAAYAPFKNAQKAIVSDTKGKEYPVTMILGANDMYDVVKFKVDNNKASGLQTAKAAPSEGQKLYVMHYSTSHVNPREGSITKAETFRDTYKYYTFTANPVADSGGSPVLNSNGEAVGMMQGDGTDMGYALDINFIKDLKMGALSINDATLRGIAIPKDIPEDYTQAQVALYMAANASEDIYQQTIDLFISRFPDKPEGYKAKAELDYMRNNFKGAEDDLAQAEKYTTDKAEIHSQRAKLIFQKNTFKSDVSYPDWTMDKALQECITANSISPQPLYIYQKAELLFAMQRYRESVQAFNEYKGMMGDNVDHQFYFGRYQAELQAKLYQQALADIDSAITKNSSMPTYRAEKANLQYRLGQFDDAINTAEDCLSQYADYSDVHLILGLSRIRKGQKAEGLASLRKAQELGNPQAAALIEKYSR